MESPYPRPLQGVLFLVIATACFAVLDATVKYLSLTVSVLLAVWFRYVFQAITVSVVMLPLRGRALLRTEHPRFQLLRGCLLLLMSILGFISLSAMPVAEFTAMVMVSPIMVTLLAAVFLKEQVSALRWALVAGGFTGALLIIRPGGTVLTLSWAGLLPVLLVFINAWFQILTSHMARTEDPVTMHFYTGWTGALVSSAILPFAWQAIPDWTTLALLGVVGLLGTIGHLLLIMAYARAPASTLSPYLYTQIGFAMVVSWLIFNHIPDQWSLIGIGLIAFCGTITAWNTARRNRFLVSPPKG